MLRIFTTPNVMQNYISDLITYRFLSELNNHYSRSILNEESNEIHILHDKEVPQILKNVMNSYKGFISKKVDNKYIWVYNMKASRNYSGNKLFILLEDKGNYFAFTSYILLGKKRRRIPGISIFGFLAVLSMITLLGIAGSYEQDMISTMQFIGYSAIDLLVLLVSTQIEQRITPHNSDESQKIKEIQ